jgi:hypothetical protein
LLVVSIVMMVSNAPASRAQTVHPNPSLAPTQWARLPLPAPAKPHQGSTAPRQGSTAPHQDSTVSARYPDITLVRTLVR